MLPIRESPQLSTGGAASAASGQFVVEPVERRARSTGSATRRAPTRSSPARGRRAGAARCRPDPRTGGTRAPRRLRSAPCTPASTSTAPRSSATRCSSVASVTQLPIGYGITSGGTIPSIRRITKNSAIRAARRTARRTPPRAPAPTVRSPTSRITRACRAMSYSRKIWYASSAGCSRATNCTRRRRAPPSVHVGVEEDRLARHPVRRRPVQRRDRRRRDRRVRPLSHGSSETRSSSAVRVEIVS